MTTQPPIKPDLGLYQTKYLLRDWLRRIPGLDRLSPNALSLVAALPGGAAAYCLYQGWWLGAVGAIALRLVINTLDGLVAEEFHKTSNLGAYLNRLPGEFTDLLIILGLWHHGAFPWTLALVVLTGWVQIMGLLGLVAGGKVQSVGPCGQTDRLVLIGLGAIAALFYPSIWTYLVPTLCGGCLLTLRLRIHRSLKEIALLDQP